MNIRIRCRAQSTVELVAGLIVLVPIVLYLFDLGALVLAKNTNGDLAKKAARAAAAASDPNIANTSAISIVSTFSGGTKSAVLTCLIWNPPTGASTTFGTLPTGAPATQPGQVLALTTLTAVTPAPLPGLPAKQDFVDYAIQPIIGVAPNLNTGL